MTAERIWIWFAENGNIREWDDMPFAEGTEYVLASAVKDDGWRPIESAPKDHTIIWAAFHSDLYPRLCPSRPDLERWNGVQVPLRHPGVSEDGFDIGWSIAAPVGNGGFPDEWLAGWRPLPSPPSPPEPSK